MTPHVRRAAIVGGGWAGLAAAIALAQAGWQVTLHEAARMPGGRARSLELGGARPLAADNGQHILIGAYTECLRLMRCVGVDPEQALLRRPLALRHADGTGLRLPRWPAPLEAMAGIATARGWTPGERAALLARAVRWRRQGFACHAALTVATLCDGLPPRLMAEFIEPLCVSALNLPAARASAGVFLRVLRDALFAGTGGSHFLVPRQSLGALFPEPAVRWLRERGHGVHCASRVLALHSNGPQWTLRTSAAEADETPDYDAIILACPPWEAARLALSAGEDERLAAHDAIALADWAALAQGLEHTAIATVYARSTEPGQRLAPDLPWLALRSGPGRPAQFVFDRGHLSGSALDQGLMAFVVSDCREECAPLQAQVLAQAAHELGWHGLRPVRTIVEKRATFACTPALQRPGVELAPGLFACGDHVAGPYPATLEGAVRSALAAARAAMAMADSSV